MTSAEQFLCTSCKLDLPYTNDHKHHTNDLFRKFVYEPKIKSAAAFLFYYRHGVAQKLLYALKYDGNRSLGVYLGQLMAEQVEGLALDVIVPVPLHRSKQRKRGYNQSEQLAIGISEGTEVRLDLSLVKREKATQTQTKKNKVQRWTSMENVYAPVKKSLAGCSVLLVDDVITTGATVGMLCQRLVEAEVEAIHLLCLARRK